MEKEVKISQEKIDAAYAEATGAVKQVLDRLFKDTRPVTERIKTFEDALAELGGGSSFSCGISYVTHYGE